MRRLLVDSRLALLSQGDHFWSYSTRRSCDGAIAGGDGESSNAPLTV